MTQVAASQQPAPMSAQQRARKSRSGENAARAILGMNPVNEEAEQRQTVGRYPVPGPRGNYSSPTEFLAGPRQPPRMSSGIRRNPNANTDSVGRMLTDEYFMSPEAGAGNRRRGAAPKSATEAPEAAASYGAAAKRGEGAARNKKNRGNNAAGSTGAIRYRDGLANNCSVTAPEKEWRSGVKMTHAQEPMDAPYFEDNDPRPPRDAVSITGKRRVPPPVKDAKLFGQAPPPKKNGEDDGPNDLPPCRKTANKANESVDVLNLYCYSADELNEAPVPYKQLGPRKFVALDMPPAKPVAIKPINTPARQEHDVLGTGRWGVPEKQQPRGVARGACRPPRDTANLFAGGIKPAPEDEKSTSGPRSSRRVEPYRASSRSGSAKKREDPVFDPDFHPSKQLSKKNAASPNLLRYYDPSVDPTPAPGPKHPVPRSNLECKADDSNTPNHRGRGRGEFSNNSRSTIALI